jgi:hypothetical protein
MRGAAVGGQRRIPFIAARVGRPASGLPRAPRTPHAAPLAQRVPLALDLASVRNSNRSCQEPKARATPEPLAVRFSARRLAMVTAVVTAVVLAPLLRRRRHRPGRRAVRVLLCGEDGARAEGQRQGECGCAYELLHNLSNLSFKFLCRIFSAAVPGRVRPSCNAPRPAQHSLPNRNGRANSRMTKHTPFPPRAARASPFRCGVPAPPSKPPQKARQK